MKPTFLRVGVPKNTVRPPTTVLSPTDTAAAPSAIDVISGVSVTDGTEVMTMPTNAPGDRIFIGVTAFNQPVDATPTGWTALVDALNTGGGERWYCYYKDITSTITTVDLDSTGAGEIRWCAITVRSPGVQSVSSTYTSTNNTKNPPAVTPSTGAGDYLVLTFNWGNTSDTPSNPAGSTGYTDLYEAGSTGFGSAWMHIQKNTVAIATSEDPSSYTYPSSGLGAVSGGFTVAILGEAASIAPADHTHVEADVTDLAHTDADAIHDNVASEISAITAKGTPTTSDFLLIEDAADSNNKKSITIGDLPGVTDHGALTGLADDDHTQYLLADGTRAATYLEVSGLTGATGSSPRFVGGTTTGAPASGTFALGDYVVTEDGNVYICTTAGSPGTWTAVGAAAATDADAIHDNVASEISALTLVNAASGDHILIEDASDSNNKKRVAASDFLGSGSFSGVMATRTTDQTGVVTATSTAVVFNGTEDFDTDAYHDTSTNPERITIPSGKAGYYSAYAYVIFDANNTGTRRLGIRVNGTTLYGQQVTTALSGGNYPQLSINVAPLNLSVSDYIEAVVYQDSGANRTLSGSVVTMRFGATLLGT